MVNDCIAFESHYLFLDAFDSFHNLKKKNHPSPPLQFQNPLRNLPLGRICIFGSRVLEGKGKGRENELFNFESRVI